MLVKRILLTVLLIVLGVTLLAHFSIQPIAYAADLYVGGEPGDYPTIAAAIDAAHPGDTVVLRSGIYTEDVVIDKPGIMLEPAFGAQAVLDGNITLTAAAGGTSITAIQMLEGKSILVEDGIEWPVSLPEGAQSRVFLVTGGDQRLDVTLGDAKAHVNFADIGGPTIFAQGEHSTITHTGTVAVETTAPSSSARGFTIVTGNSGQASLGAIDVRADRLAIGMHFFTGDGGQLAVNGDIVAQARGVDSLATGAAIRGQTGVIAELQGVEVDGGRNVVGVDFNVADVGTLVHTGSVVATARDEGSEAYGVLLGAGNGSSLTLGDISVQGGALARGVTTTYPSGTVVVTDGLLSNVSVRVGNVHAVARDADSDAYGIDLDFENNLSLTAGNVHVESQRLARAVWLRTHGEGGSVVLTGDVSAISATGSAQGLLVQAGSDFQAAVHNVRVEGASAAVHGAALHIGDGGTLLHQGLIEVAGTSAAATVRGINVVAGDTFTASIADVHVEGISNALGLYWQTEDHGKLVQNGTIRATTKGAGGNTGAATILAGNELAIAADKVEAIAQGDDATATGVYLMAGNDLTARFRSVTATGMRGATALTAIVQDGATLQVDRIESVSQGEAYGLQLIGKDALTVDAKEVLVQGGSSARGIVIEADGAHAVDVGKVRAEAGDVAYGIVSRGADNTVTIHDEIVAGAAAPAGYARGLVVEQGVASVTNHGSVFVSGHDAVGVELGVASGLSQATFHNLGTVEAATAAGAAVVIKVTDSATVQNDGFIDAGTGSAFHAQESTGSITLENSGTIRGDVVFGQGADIVTVGENGRIDGAVHMGAGDDAAFLHYGAGLTGILDGGAGEDSLTLLGVAASDLPLGSSWNWLTARGIEQAWVYGGAWQWGIGTDLGAVEVYDAYLRIDDAVTVAELKLEDGALVGVGNITGNVTNAGGVVSSGGSYGILTITGTYTQGPDGVLHIELDASVPPQAGVTHDQLVIVGGTAIFADGTTVRVRPTFGATLPDRAEYLIVDGDVVFDPNAIHLDLAIPRSLFFDGWLEEGSMKLILAVTAFDSVAETPNQKAVAEALTEAKGQPDTDLDDLYDWLVSLDPEQEDVARAAYDSLSGEVYTHLPTLAAERLQVSKGALFNGLAHPAAEPLGRVWALPYSDLGRVASGPGTAGSRFQLSGIVAGADLVTTPNSRLGFSVGAAWDSLTMEDRASEMQGQGYHIGMYGTLDLGDTRLTTLLGHNKTTYQSQRRLVFGDVYRDARAKFTTTDWAATAKARFRVPSSPALRIEPVVSVGYYHTSRPSFTEQGAGTVGLVVDAMEVGWWQGRVGLELTGEAWSVGQSTVHPRASLAWVNDLTPVERLAVARLQGVPGYPFTIRGTEAQRGGLEASIGLQGEAGDGAVWRLDYTGTFREDMSSHAVMARIGWRF